MPVPPGRAFSMPGTSPAVFHWSCFDFIAGALRRAEGRCGDLSSLGCIYEYSRCAQKASRQPPALPNRHLHFNQKRSGVHPFFL
jgi:hypothetical protein